MHHSTVEACRSASELSCTHPALALLIPVLLILAVLAGSGLAAYVATRGDR